MERIKTETFRPIQVKLIVLLLSILITSSAVIAGEESSGINWNIPADLNSLGVSNELLQEMDQELRQRDSRYKKINSVIILKEGQLVFENYYNGYTQKSLFDLCSAAKTFTGALIGIAIDQGLIDGVSEKVIKYFPEYMLELKDPGIKDVKIENLLTMTSGLDWDESGLAGNGLAVNPIKYALGLSVLNTPGKKFNYSSLDTHILSGIITKATGMKALQYGKEYLFGPLGIESVQWSNDPQGNNIGGSAMGMKARDMARFGQLYLNQGEWNGRQIISSEWIKNSTSIHNYSGSTDSDSYGYLTWIHNGEYNAFYASGYGGQYIYVVPELKMVVVITSKPDEHRTFHLEIVNKYIVPAVTG